MSRHKVRKWLQSKFLNVGKFVLLFAILVVVGLLSSFLSMRFAVRGTEVEVPKVEKKSAEEARQILEEVNLKLGVSGERYDPELLRGAVIWQHPGAGVRIKAEQEVQVILSLGVHRMPVPQLKGSTRRAAESMLLQSGYELGHVSAAPLFSGRKDEVVQQAPVPGDREILDPRVHLLVNRDAPARYVMPDMIGKDINKVITFFERAGFQLGHIQYQVYRNIARGTVVKQFPEPGYMLTQKDSINLEVAR